MSYELEVQYLPSHFIVLCILGVATGPSKTVCLTKFLRHFTGLTVSFFSGYMHLTVSILFTKLSHGLDFFVRLKKS